MKIRKNNLILILNILLWVLFSLPIMVLDLFTQNYSTLTLNVKGYFYVLILGICLGLLLAYETYFIQNKNKKLSILMFLSLFIGTLIPHHIPYNLQGNLHLFCAYLGFSMLMIVTYLNLYLKENKKLKSLFMLSLLASFLVYLKANMVNSLSEIIIMYAVLFINYRLYKPL